MSKETVLITGASSGFGEAIARVLAAEGHALYLLARREDKLKKLKAELKTESQLIVCDLTDGVAVKKALAPLAEKITVIINNAGLALGIESAPRASLEDWMTMVDTNIKGVLAVTHAILPVMAEKHRGLIINIGSVAGNHPYPGGNVYGATKAFLKQFSLNLRADLLRHGVRVTNIEPGAVETEFSKVRFKGDESKAGKVYEGWGDKNITKEDIAELVRWIVNQPPRVNINSVEIMGVGQAFAGFAFARD